MKMMKKLAALVLALMMVMSVAAGAEGNVLAIVNGAEVPAAEAQAEFEYWASMYEMYGMTDSIEDLRTEIMDYYIEEYLIDSECAERGFDRFTEEEEKAFVEQAETEYYAMLDEYMVYFAEEGMTDEEVRQSVIDYFEENGYNVDALVGYSIKDEMRSRCYKAITADVEITDEDIAAMYNERVESQKAAYESDSYNFESDAMYGEMLYYIPEGFRAVHHILLMLDAEAQSMMYDFMNELDDIALRMSEDGADQDALAEEQAAVQAQMDELCAPLLETAETIYARLDNGEDFFALMAEYNEDPGMDEEPFKSNGYYVSEDSMSWEENFKLGALALEKVGDVSQPVMTPYGLHLIHYTAELAPGAIELDAVRESIEEEAYAAACDECYAEWVAGLHEKAEIQLFPDSLGYIIEEE